MIDEHNFDLSESRFQQRQANLARLAEIRNELKILVQARNRLLRELATLKATLESHRQAGAAIRLRAMQILARLTKRAEAGISESQLVTSDDERLLNELEASRIQLEKDVQMTERRLKIAQFEADSLAELLEELEDQVAEIAAELEGGENRFPNERN